MNKLLFVSIAAVLAFFVLMLFYNIQFNTEASEILVIGRNETITSFILSYKGGFSVNRIIDIENGFSGWRSPEKTIDETEEIILPFKKGETLIYDVYSAGFKTGQSVLKFHGEKYFNGESAYYITFDTELPFFKDYEEIYAEKKTFLPLNIKRKIVKMGGLSVEEIEETYDQSDFSVKVKKKGAFSTQETVIQKEGPIYNSILLTYLCRIKPEMAYNEAFKIVLPTMEFNISVSGQDKIQTPSGEYTVDIFQSDPLQFTFYLSRDDERLPIKITSHTALRYTMILNSRENED